MEKSVIKCVHSSTLKLGDVVIWRGSWGKDLPQQAKVKFIEVGDHCTMVDEIDWNELTDRSVTVVLDNGHWAYGYQLSPAV
jgi:primase-polymerase (primpol)-like protein